MKNVCVVIPIYKVEPSKMESQAIENAINKFSNFDIAYVGPWDMDTTKYPCAKSKGCLLSRKIYFEGFESKYFESVDGYSRLLLLEKFYNRFDKYEYILIVQSDVWILRNDFDISKYIDYDYVGAPWPEGLEVYRFSFKGVSIFLKFFRAFCRPRICRVGNGGFSLRNVSACRKLVADNRLYARIWHTGEDVFFAYFGLDEANEFKLATIDVAESFALEQNAKEKIEMGHIPVGVHAWEKWYPELLEKQVGM